jgi:hypothetical protein
MRRRQFVFASFGVVLCGAGVGCAGGDTTSTSTGGGRYRFEQRFARYPVADEPNGDLSTVAWPLFVTGKDPEVKRLYEFQVTHGELMRYMPCFCGCGEHDGHMNNRDCYVQRVNADRSVVLDPMAPT